MTRRPLFWIAYCALSLVALFVAARLFPLAIPLVNLDIKMERAQALAQGEAVGKRYGLAPPDARAAARFSHDSHTQNYVELEGGGRSAFAELTRGDLYAPYWWDVRLFAPGTIEESVIRFKPDGTPYGFNRRLPETYVHNPATKALDATQARALAEDRAHADWHVDFSQYKLLEHSQQTMKNDRVDHAFVYERPEKLGDARIRLTLSVKGDELTSVVPFVFVPESFDRRYQELRSANNLIAGAASAAAGLLYGIGGCILAVLWLLRRHWLLWRPAFVAGLVVGGLLALSGLAAAPENWFRADTTETLTTFWFKQAGAFIFLLTAAALGYALAFMAAESLSRRAFPHQPQLWRLWSREGGPTRQALGRTVGGYLFVPLELALVAAFYYATNKWLGWWQPSEMLSDPNILGSWIPSLSPIAISLQAGFMEECVFRAIPLSLGALIGQRYGRRTLGIAIAFVLQALVFGGAHANYPGFPSYARLVELIVPSMIWALIFLRFGLLTTVILHATFDLTLFAIPIFLVDAPYAFVQQALIVAAGLVPLAMIAWRRVQAGAWRELPESLRNGAWQPQAAAIAEAAHEPHASALSIAGIASAFQRALPALGIAGAIAWLVFTPFHVDAPVLTLDRDAAIAIAEKALAGRGVKLGDEWQRMATIKLATDDGPQWQWHKFVWREAGPETYRKLIGNALAPPIWDVRFAKFEGDVAERAEEWRIAVAGDGTVRTLRHALPQGRAGARLSRDAALALADRELRNKFGIDPAAVKEVGADENNRVARTDWAFMFTDPRVDVGKDGELRYIVQIAGDEVAGSGRLIQVPEEWQRAEQRRDNRQSVVKISAGIVFLLAGLAGIVLGVMGWTKGRCDTRAVKIVAALSFVLALLALANAWPLVRMQLGTAEPVASQVSMLLLGALVGALLAALLFGLTSGIGAWYARSAHRVPLAGMLPPWAAAVAAALFVAGLESTLSNLGRRDAPLWPSLSAASLWSPVAGGVITGLGIVTIAGIALFIVYLAANVTRNWTRRLWIGFAIVVVLQVAAVLGQTGANVLDAIGVGVIAGIVTAAILWLLLRFDPTIVPAYVATGPVLTMLWRAIQVGTSLAYVTGAAAIAATIAMTWLVTRYIQAPLAPAPSATADPALAPALPSDGE
ncbi:MAG TPA: type II CAAX endopeptidase family protein [Casimicrobiaceae bacterium]